MRQTAASAAAACRGYQAAGSLQRAAACSGCQPRSQTTMQVGLRGGQGCTGDFLGVLELLATNSIPLAREPTLTYSSSTILCPARLSCRLHRPAAASEAETEWSDGVAVGYKMEQQRRLGVGFLPLLRTKPVWAICVAQYTGSWGFYGKCML